MKLQHKFLLSVLCLMPAPVLAYVPTTVGNNLTAYNSNMGAINNNNWNNMTNGRSDATAPTADFGNCNSLILRCANPKCGSGCTTADVARPIVAGCVNSNSTCKKFGDDLIDSLTAQMVATSNQKAATAANNAATAAAQSAAAQSSAQMQQMQLQMQQMQQEMQEQNEQARAELAAALQEQQRIAEETKNAAVSNAIADASAPGLTVAQTNAVEQGVSADVLMRQQASGEILSSIENAETSMKALNTVMQNAFDYAGCDRNGNNCKGPKRMAKFKALAREFFDPYDTVLDQTYDALVTAMTLGVDISDVLMLLNDSCNRWGEYICRDDQDLVYNAENCVGGLSKTRTETVVITNDETKETNKIDKTKSIIEGKKCTIGETIPESAGGCKLIKLVNTNEEVPETLLGISSNSDSGSSKRYACASDAVFNSSLFSSRSKKKSSAIGVELLRQMLEQEAGPENEKTGQPVLKNYCATGDTDSYSTMKSKLQKMANSKKLDAKNCQNDNNNGAPSGTAVACDTEDLVWVVPELALCEVHVYNIGENENSSDSTGREHVSEIVALKTTVFTQQLKKQYDYLNATIKRLKTQLKKAVLTSNLQAAGARSESSGSDSTINLDGVSDCWSASSQSEQYECLIGNINAMMQEVNKNGVDTSALKKQIENDISVFGEGVTECKNGQISSKSGIKTCLNKFKNAVFKAQAEAQNNKGKMMGTDSNKGV